MLLIAVAWGMVLFLVLCCCLLLRGVVCSCCLPLVTVVSYCCCVLSLVSFVGARRDLSLFAVACLSRCCCWFVSMRCCVSLSVDCVLMFGYELLVFGV